MVEKVASCGHVSGRRTVTPRPSQDACELVQVLRRLLDDSLRERAARDLGQRAVGELRQLRAPVRRGEPRAHRVADDDFLERIPLVATPDP